MGNAPRQRAILASGGSPSESRADLAAFGLSDEQVREQIGAGRVNITPPTVGRTFTQILRANVLTRFNAILGSLFVIVIIVGPLQDALFGIVLAANTAIGIFQEIRTKRTLDRLAILHAPKAHVIRNGEGEDVMSADIVLGDVLELHPGDQVPVDGEVLVSHGLELDEALLSGEAEPVLKLEGADVLSGSYVTAGSGRIVAAAVGSAAYARHIEAQARRFSLIHSELQQGTNWILRLVTWIMVPTGVLLVISELLRTNQSLPDALRGSVAGVGAMVPEGLVLLTSIAFAVGALRLAQRKVLVQEIAAIEGLARVDVLCIDKTGTLTEPGIALQKIETLSRYQLDDVQRVLSAMGGADPSPNATMRAVIAEVASPSAWTAGGSIPFSSARKWSATGFGEHGTWVLGAPEIVAEHLPDDVRSRVDEHENQGRRVLLLAEALEPIEFERQDPPLPRLAAAALLVFFERLRADASSTVHFLIGQGIAIKVLSGDAPKTVAVIADRVGIPLLEGACDAHDLSDRDLSTELEVRNVFGRVRPEQKLQVVQALQDKGHVVAMVGDGVNDVQALKQADLGIAMGSGSPSSRSVARIVLLDSSFAAVPEVLGEGRKVIANIERVGNLFVNKTVYAALLAVVVGISGVPFPFFPRHLTIVTTFTIGVPGFFLAFIADAPRATPGFARRVLEFTIPAGLVGGCATFASYAIARATPGTSAAASRTAAALVLVGFGLWVLILIARPLTLVRIGLIVVMALGATLVFTIPLSHRVLALQFPPAIVQLSVILLVVGAIGVLSLFRVWAPRWSDWVKLEHPRAKT